MFTFSLFPTASVEMTMQYTNGFRQSEFNCVSIHFKWQLFNFDCKEAPGSSISAFLYGIDCPAHPILVHHSVLTSATKKKVYPTYYTKTESILLWFKDTVPTHIMMNVFGYYANTDKGAWPALHHIGFATSPLTHSKVSLVLRSETTAVLGNVQFEIVTHSASEQVYKIMGIKDRFTPALQLATQYAENMTTRLTIKFHKECTLSPLFENTSSPLTHVTIRGQVLPMAYVLASVTKVTSDYQQAILIFSWWLQFAKSNLGLDLCDDISNNYSDDFLSELIAEMFTLPMKGLIYSHDSYKNQFGLFTEEEQWTLLTMFPDLSAACFDCEDGMIMCVQVLNAFMALTFPTEQSSQDATSWNIIEELNFIQSHLRDYQICYAIGQLKVGEDEATKKPEYVLHAFPLLLDKCLFTATSITQTKHAKPTILLETTNYLSSMFTEKERNNEHEALAFDKQDTIMDDFALKSESQLQQERESISSSVRNKNNQQSKVDSTLDEHWRYIIHFKAPVRRIVSEHIFGLLHSLFTQVGNEFVQFHVTTEKESANNNSHSDVKLKVAIGGDITDILFGGARKSNKDSIYFKRFCTVTEKDLQAMSPLALQNVPFSLPYTEAGARIPHPLNSLTHKRFLVKHVGCNFDIGIIRDRFKKLIKGNEQMYEITTYLFAKCKMTIFDVPLSVM